MVFLRRKNRNNTREKPHPPDLLTAVDNLKGKFLENIKDYHRRRGPAIITLRRKKLIDIGFATVFKGLEILFLDGFNPPFGGQDIGC